MFEESMGTPPQLLPQIPEQDDGAKSPAPHIKIAIGVALALLVFAFSDLALALTFAGGFTAALLLGRG